MHAEPKSLQIADSDVQHCRWLLKQGSKTFSAASWLLPRRLRDSVTALYAFCRVADDAIDGAERAQMPAVLQSLKQRLDGVYAGAPEDHPVDRALSVTVLQHDIPRVLLDALVEGFVWDAEGRSYATINDVYAYGARVAGAVGAMMTVLMGRRDALTLARACDMGVAMQLTNIARDVGEDARMGRLYLPLSWMKEAGIDTEDFLANPRFSNELAQVVERLLAEANRLYTRADEGIARLPLDCRASIYAARLIYARIGRRVEDAGLNSVDGRAYVPLRTKIWLLIQAMVKARWLGGDEQKAPALLETQFLVDAVAPR